MSLSPAKTSNTVLLAWTDIASAGVNVGPAVDVTTKFVGGVFARIGRGTGTAFTAGWPNIRVEASAKASGNDSWIPVAVFQPTVGTSIANTTLNGAVSAGASTFVVTSATNIAVGDLLFLGDVSTANYELVRVKGVSGTTITPEEPVVYAHTTGALVTDQADMFYAQIDLLSVVRLRTVTDNAGSGQAIRVEVLLTTADSVG